MWALLRVMAEGLGVLLLLVLPMAMRSAIPDPLFDLWDSVLTPLRNPVNSFWWQYFHRYDQQPLFQLSTLLTQAAIITAVIEVARWLWRRHSV